MFSQIGLPEQIKADNSPAYTYNSPAAFKNFFVSQQFPIVHSTRMPYNPQGQAMIRKSAPDFKKSDS